MSNSTGRALEPEQVLDVLEDRDRDERPVMTSNEIADVLINERGIDVTSRTVKNRLDELERADEVATHTPGRTAIYWLPGEHMVGLDKSGSESDEEQHTDLEVADPDGGIRRDDPPKPIRERGIEVFDKFQEDLAYLTAEGLTAQRIGLWRHLKILATTNFLTFIGGGVFFYQVIIGPINDQLVAGAVALLLLGLVLSGLALGSFVFRYRREFANAKDDLSLPVHVED